MSSIVVPADYSNYSFPEFKGHVSRDGLINTIEMYLDANDVVFVYGEEGFGKTSVLAEFFSRHEKSSIVLSIDPINKYSYYLESLIRDIILQVKIYLNQDVDITNGIFDKKEMVKNFGTLEYIIKKHNKELYVVMDGLDQIPDDDDSYIKDLLDYLPIGKKNIKFLFSAKKGMLEKSIKSRKTKSINIDLFSLEETKKLLPGIGDDKLRVLLNSFRATPEMLSSIKRLTEQGVTIDDILQMDVEDTEGLFEEEWSRSESVVEKYKEFLGILAFSKTSLSLEQISLEIGMRYESIIEAECISFLHVTDKHAKFRSVGFAKFARKKLKDLRMKSLRYITNIMTKTPKSLDSLSSLPSYFNDLGDTQAVISHLSNENLELLLSESKSLNDLFRQLDLGISCAEDNELEMLRFSFLKSLVTGIKTSSLLKSELKNFLIKEDVKTALDLAHGAASKEEQLQILCMIAADYKEKEKPLPESIELQIETLFQGISPESLGVEKTLDIAMDLLPFDSAKAMSLINQIDQMGGGGENKSEYAFFRFTLHALQKKPDAFDGEIEIKNFSEKKSDACQACWNLESGGF
ncbi:ATP-binding protein [Franzmannia pantelleriensis]|nr:ATP-binding protein [Halomonas pantelleriensis]